MRPNNLCSGLLFTLVVAQSVFASSSSNWLTKSLDYFAYEKCSYLEKSDLTGKFYKCLNQPKRDRRAASFGDFGSFADYSKYVPKQPTAGASSGSDPVKTGSTHGGGFGGNMIPDFASKYQNQKEKPQKEQPSIETEYYDSNDSKYPIGACREEKKISKCLAIFAEAECLTEKEHQFFEDLEFFFRVRSQFLCRNASKVAKLISDNDCGSKMNGQDIQQQCYSLNSQAQFIEWQPNWEDGKVCDLLNGLAKCEADFASQCGNKVHKFVQDSWEVPMRVTPCKAQKSVEVSVRSRRAATSLGFFDSISKINGPGASGSFMDGFPNFFKKSSKKVEAKKPTTEEATTEVAKPAKDEDEPEEDAPAGGFAAYNKNKQIMKKFKDEFGGGFPFKRRRRSTFMNGMKFQTKDKMVDSDSYFKDYIGAFGKQTAAKKSDDSAQSKKPNNDSADDDSDDADSEDKDSDNDSASKSPSTASGKGFGGDFGKFMNDFMDWSKFMKSGPGSQYGKQPKSASSSDSSDSSDSKNKKLFKRSVDDKAEKKDDADDDKMKDFSDFIKKIVQEEIKKSKSKEDKSESGEKSEANESSEKKDDADKKKKKQSLDDAFADYFKKKFGKKSKDDQKEKDKEDNDAEKKKDEAERLKEKAAQEAERKKDEAEREAERKKDEAEREAERKKDEAEREAERKKDEAERKKQKAEYQKEMAAYYKEKYGPKKVSTTTVAPTTEQPTEASAEAQPTTTDTAAASVNTEAAQVSAETTTSGNKSDESETEASSTNSSENSSEASPTTTESTPTTESTA